MAVLGFAWGAIETAAVQGDPEFWEETRIVADSPPHFPFFVQE